jgi:hypothetical protein
VLARADAGGEDLADQLDVQRWLDQLTPARLGTAATTYLDLGRFVRVTLLPAKTAAAGQ